MNLHLISFTFLDVLSFRFFADSFLLEFQQTFILKQNLYKDFNFFDLKHFENVRDKINFNFCVISDLKNHQREVFYL